MLKEPEEERREKRSEIDGTVFSIVSYLHGLNALGSWPWSVPVHIIKPHEAKEGALEPRRRRGRVSQLPHARIQRQPLSRRTFIMWRIFFSSPRISDSKHLIWTGGRVGGIKVTPKDPAAVCAWL